MLEAYRQIVGETAFFAFRRALLTEHGTATSTPPSSSRWPSGSPHEQAGFEASNLTKLDMFFEQWLYGTVKPTMTPTTFFLSSAMPGDVNGTVPATLSLSLGTAPSFGSFIAGRRRGTTRQHRSRT